MHPSHSEGERQGRKEGERQSGNSVGEGRKYGSEVSLSRGRGLPEWGMWETRLRVKETGERKTGKMNEEMLEERGKH